MTTKSFWSSSKAFPALLLIAAASYFLLIEHRQHLFEWLPFLIIALCPLLHIFMHGSHSGHGSHNDHSTPGKDGEAEDAAYRRGLEDGKKQSDVHRHH